MPEVLHPYSFPQLLYLLLLRLLSLFLSLVSELNLLLYGLKLFRPLMHPLDGPHHLVLLLVKQTDPIL